MKIFKKLAFGFLAFLLLMSVGGYIYFDQKFTPEKNYLMIKNASGIIPVSWLGNDKNAMLLPIRFPGNKETFYLQFDTGSPYTLFYSGAIKNIKEINIKNGRAKAVFYVGNSEISSDKFRIFKNEISNRSDSVKIIGTIGADVLEDRKTVINLRENYVAFNLQDVPDNFKNNLTDFKFKKRKIILPGILNGEKRNFLYDTGTSAYELLTYREEWGKLKSKTAKVKIEKSKSWNDILTTYTADCRENIKIGVREIAVSEITYVEGFSDVQFSLMKFSGMTGMLGNKIFLNNSIFLDCERERICIN